MATSTLTISVRGRPVSVPCLNIGSIQVVTSGKWLKRAFVHDEEWIDPAALPDPAQVVAALKESGVKADLFTFAQPLTDKEPHHSYSMEWDNAAVIPITTYAAWSEQLPQVARRNIRTATKKGVEIRQAPFDDDFVRGIKAVYDEAPTRLGKAFWHYGKDLETVRRENGTYAERSDYIGAFFEGQMIGFIKIVYVGRVGSMMQILSMIKHQDKRTTNALVSKAVEICAAKGMSHLMYCKYVYDGNEGSPLTDFKRRNGFEPAEFPRYYVPLSAKGRLALALHLHHGIKGLLPKPVLRFALRMRAKYYTWKDRKAEAPATASD